jgi:hypothetical protein
LLGAYVYLLFGIYNLLADPPEKKKKKWKAKYLNLFSQKMNESVEIRFQTLDDFYY